MCVCVCVCTFNFINVNFEAFQLRNENPTCLCEKAPRSYIIHTPRDIECLHRARPFTQSTKTAAHALGKMSRVVMTHAIREQRTREVCPLLSYVRIYARVFVFIYDEFLNFHRKIKRYFAAARYYT